MNKTLSFTTANNTEAELETVALLQGLIEKHDVRDYIFTDQVLIRSGAIPHSHPVLTLNTRHNKNPERLLSCFLHEQIHWFAENNDEQVRAAIEEIRNSYPQVPNEARTEFSSYLHVIINFLEYRAGVRCLGESKAREMMMGMDVYPGIYKFILANEASIQAILHKFSLII